VARSSRDAVLALAGIFQSARLVQQLAREGRADADGQRALIQSVLAIDAPAVEAVYGGAPGLRLGLDLLRSRLHGHSSPADVELARYVVAVIHLENVLRKRPDLLDAIRRGIETAQERMKFFEADGDAAAHPLLIEKLAELYSQTLSTLTPRIMVSGEHGHLSNPAIAARVRAMLLAGIRSAVLWRQLGGRRWQLLFARGRIARTATELLSAGVTSP
jgi:high frequency lysogenization protein